MTGEGEKEKRKQYRKRPTLTITGMAEPSTETENSAVSSDQALPTSDNNSCQAIELHTYSETSEPNVLCIASDETGARTTRHFVTLPHSSSVSDLYSAVAKEAGYKEGSFELYWRRQDSRNEKDDFEEKEKDEILEWKSTATLHEISMPTDPIKVKAFVRQKEDGSLPVKVSTVVQESLQDAFTTSTFSSNTSTSNTSNGTSGWGSSGWNSSGSSGWGYSSGWNNNYQPKPDTGYVGLVNQAMTCYLNSLIQALYMTPEFRNALYSWRFVGDEIEASKIIPLQLQKLFLQLQTSRKRSVETTDLTKSFGWDSSEAWQQHDIQELCRVLFDALERQFKKDKAPKANLINELYQGKMKDYVKCLNCGYESARVDDYLDIPLVIKPFGSNTSYPSVEEALAGFVQPETLNGADQYFCEKCDKKTDAHKGLKFTSFPYLLTLQLKRFDFDYASMHRIKLNDKMTFPKVLDLNAFVDPPEKPPVESEMDEQLSTYLIDQFDNPPPYNSTINRNTKDNKEAYNEIDVESSVDANSSSVNTIDVRQLLTKGSHVYELFAIMIHSGSAIGGHYYAYIKALTGKKQWYCFNDQSVTMASEDDIQQTFGGASSKTKSYYSSAMYTSSTNAYMLMYRRIDPKKNEPFTETKSLPPHLLKVIEEEQNHEKKEQQRQEQEKNYCKFRLFCRRPNSSEIVEKKLEVHKDLTIPEATKEAYKVLELKSCVPIERCRLVRYDEYVETLDQSFDDPEGTTFGQAVGGVKTYYSFELFMEIRNEDQQFRIYNRGGISLKICVVDVTTKTSKEPVVMRAESGWIVGALKKEIAEQFHLNVTTMRLAFELSGNESRLLSVDTNTLKSEGLYRKHTVFVCCDPEDFQLQYLRSTMFSVVDKHINSVLLYVTYPLPSLPGSSTATPGSSMATPGSSTATPGSRSHSEGEGVGENPAPSPKGEVQPPGDGERETAADVSGCKNKPAASSPSAGQSCNGERLPVYGCENKKENVKTISLRIDKRSTVEDLKKVLESYVGLSSSEFKVYRLYSNNQEFEMTRLNEMFQSMPSETKLTVKFGRALLPGEYRIKAYLLRMNDPEYCVYVLDTVVSKGVSVRQFKEQLVKEVSLQSLPFELNIERLRLRKKAWRSAGTIYLDDQVFDKDIPLFSAFEVYIEQLKGPDQMKESSNMQIYIRHWHPSTYTVDPTDEVIISESHPNHLRKKISQECNIPWERIAIAKSCYGTFPYEMSVLEIEEDLEWNSNVSTSNSVPLSIYDDGSIIYYKDSAEKLIELTAEKRSELQKHENTRLSKYNNTPGTSSSTSYRTKEKALKFYTDDVEA